MRYTAVARAATISGFPDMARAAGLDPVMLLRAVGLSLRLLETPDTPIPARKLYQLLELSATLSGMEDFGLRMGEKRRLSSLGPLGLMMRDEPTVREALKKMIAYICLHTTCVVLRLEDGDPWSQLTMTLLTEGETQLRQVTETAMLTSTQILRQFLGQAWHPRRVTFVHSKPRSQSSHRRIFACPVEFSASRNAIVIDTIDLCRIVPLFDDGFRQQPRQRSITASALDTRTTRDQVQQVVVDLLPMGQCTSDRAAELLGISRRSLHRYLAREGATFSALVDQFRVDIARQYLAASALNITDLGALLGFAHPSAFSRWSVTRLGASPRMWRASARNRSVDAASGRQQGVAPS